MKAIWMLMVITQNSFGVYSSDGGKHLALFDSERKCVKAIEQSAEIQGLLRFCVRGLPAPVQAEPKP